MFSTVKSCENYLYILEKGIALLVPNSYGPRNSNADIWY